MILPLDAPVHHRVDRVVPVRFGALLPVGTPTVNIVGSALLGGLIGASAGTRLSAAAGTVSRGALTRFSGFGYETIRPVTVAARLIAVFVAASTTQWLWP
ncbi:fluoride efflux transporter CrcB [Nocardia sp. NPDC051321]|uniref:fluoride efflux transporter CrcB n=1 Tax=Nocardia sp. NPDC051321 TaxID=3364323 RepID=UPI00378F6009